ncbi:protein SRG1-like [Senna tora]|uniref:Protein SRG1-like n=1 Tax=Senna tora TaxID=362788 RepID=A0A834T7D0_9FABA|nr:protein SRG1-like [Senna tora]
MEVKSEKSKQKENGGLGFRKRFIAVPSVQEMVRSDHQTVPERYIQEYEKRPLTDALSSTSYEIPVIDFSLLAKRDENEQKKLDSACKEWGFFQVIYIYIYIYMSCMHIINHGVGEELIERMRDREAACFDLPLEVKNKYALGDAMQGYGQAFVESEEQKLDWGDPFFLMAYPPQYRNFHNWPLIVPSFKEIVEEYSAEIIRVSEEILANLSLLMKMKEDSLKEMHKVMRLGMRMNYYPLCSKPELVLGVSPHSDGGSITILLQDDDVTGLQVLHQGQWVPVKPLPGAFVVNLGDAMQMWSNGVYKSVEHRAITNTRKARMSIAMFVMPDNDAEMGPVDTMVCDNCPARYQRVKYKNFMRSYLDRTVTGEQIK